MFEYLPGTEQLVRAIWKKNIDRHPGDERWVNWGREYIDNHLKGLAQTFIITCDGEPVGEGTLIFSPQCSAIRGRTDLADNCKNTNLNALRIEKKYEGQGHISKLVKLMERTAKEMGYEYITIGVGEDRTRNRAIYTHWGYTDLICVHMEGDEPVLYYRKRL